MTITYPSGATVTVAVNGTDVAGRVLDVQGQQGKRGPFGIMQAGVCNVALDNTADTYAHGTGLPLGGTVTVDLAFAGVSRRWYTGTIQRRREVVTAPGQTQLVLECVDAFERLARVDVRQAVGAVAVGDGERVDQRIGRWLDAADWDGTRDVDIATGWTCPGVVLAGNVLTEVMRTAAAEGGDCYIAGDGTFTYRLWTWRTNSRSVNTQAVFGDRTQFDWVPFTSADLVDDLEAVANTVTGLRRDDGTTRARQTVDNASSVTAWGIRMLALDNLELEDDAQVATRVGSIRDVYKVPVQRWDNITVHPEVHAGRSWSRLIPLRFGDLVLGTRKWPNGTTRATNGHIIGTRWQFGPKVAKVTFLLEGTGAWDRLRPPVAPVVIIIDPTTGKVRVPDGYPCPPDGVDSVVFKDADGNVIGVPLDPSVLCGEGITPPDGAVSVCYRNDLGDTCTDLEDPRLRAVLWVDAFEPVGPMIERVTGAELPGGVGFAGVRFDVYDPGDYDAIDANGAGGVIAAGSSPILDAANLSGGWTIQTYLTVPDGVPDPDLAVVLLDAGGAVQLVLTTEYSLGPTFAWDLEVRVWDSSDVAHFSGPLYTPATGVDMLVRVVWESTPSPRLRVFIDGTEV